jgi:hypothetical protein
MIRENFREYLEELIRNGYTVRHDGSARTRRRRLAAIVSEET